MEKKTFLILLFCLSFLMLYAQHSVELAGIPEKARSFLDIHLKNYQLDKVEYESDDNIYVVKYKSGQKVKFDTEGNWLEIRRDQQPLPKSIIDLMPLTIINHIASNYPNRPIVRIRKNAENYKIELAGNYGLVYDSKGNFIKSN